MPANLTPEYFKAERWFREATTNDEKILALEQMLSVMPKHKGTDHLRADLRRKLSKLKEAPVKKGHGTPMIFTSHEPAPDRSCLLEHQTPAKAPSSQH